MRIAHAVLPAWRVTSRVWYTFAPICLGNRYWSRYQYHIGVVDQNGTVAPVSIQMWSVPNPDLCTEEMTIILCFSFVFIPIRCLDLQQVSNTSVLVKLVPAQTSIFTEVFVSLNQTTSSSTPQIKIIFEAVLVQGISKSCKNRITTYAGLQTNFLCACERKYVYSC